MDPIRREFLEANDTQDQHAPQGPAEDYALVIGVNDYPKLRQLRGAVPDAMAFAAWLIADDGGRVPLANVRTVLSTSDPLTPIGTEINDALEDILERAYKSGGRRFYFYFSGHGCVGDRASDISLCMANWSELRRRAALSSDAWLDVVVRSGAFAEVAFFLDCCRVWAVRAVGLPPHIDFAKPVEREEPTRVFVAYATELQRTAVESAEGEPNEVRGIFTKVLIDQLRRSPKYFSEPVTAHSLKSYLENVVASEALKRGFRQRAEVNNGFMRNAYFGPGKKPPDGSMRARTMPYSPTARVPTGDRPLRSWRVPYCLMTWLSLYRANLFTMLVTAEDEWRNAVSAASMEKHERHPDKPCGLFIVLIDDGASGIGWSIHGETVVHLNRENTWTIHGVGSIFWIPTPPGTYVLRWNGSRDFAMRVYPNFTTQIFIQQDNSGVHYESMRIFLSPNTRYAAEPPLIDIPDLIDEGLMALEDASSGVPRRIYDIILGAPFDEPMLGFLAAYCLARHATNVDEVEAITNQLESMLGHCSDVYALRLRIAMLRGLSLSTVPCSEPPILREGLLAFVEASHLVPQIIEPNSLLEHACLHRLIDSPLSTWPIPRDGATIENDWLSVTIADAAVASCTPIDAQALAKELGVPTLAVESRLRKNSQDFLQIMECAEPAPIQGVIGGIKRPAVSFFPHLVVSVESPILESLPEEMLRIVHVVNGTRSIVRVIDECKIEFDIGFSYLRDLVLRGIIEIIPVKEQ